MNILPIVEIGARLIDKLIPDPQAKAQAQLELIKLQQDGALQEIEVRMKAILAEAQSVDPWTSRARPAMLWTMYVLILAGIPAGIISAVSPETASDIAKGFNAWLAAIPESITEMFTFVLLGYVGGRSFEKVKGAAK